jgi:hypothetical protein
METKSTNRVCGTCTLCCKAVAVTSLKKAVGKWCPHGSPGKGCSIYAQRPDECKHFGCLWLLGLLPEEEDRPDRLKTAIYSEIDASTNQELIVFAESHPGSSQGNKRVEALMIQFLRQGRSVIVRNGDYVERRDPNGAFYRFAIDANDELRVRIVDKRPTPSDLITETIIDCSR